MSNSSLKIQRNKLARVIADEIFTIDSELSELGNDKTLVAELSNLKKMDFDSLKNIRFELQRINSSIKSVKRNLSKISNRSSHYPPNSPV